MFSFSMLLKTAVTTQGFNVFDAIGDRWDICIVAGQHINCFGASFIKPFKGEGASFIASSWESRMLYKINSSPMEWLFCCSWTWVMVDIVYRCSSEDSSSQLRRADNLLLVVQATCIVPYLCKERQDSIIGDRNCYMFQPINELPLTCMCM